MIYDPPKQKNWGSVLQAAGIGVSTVSGVVSASGVGLIPGAIGAAAGGIMAGIGAIANASNERKIAEYNNRYNAISASNDSLNQAIDSIKKLTSLK